MAKEENEDETKKAGSLAGTGAGMVAGAQVGSVLIPIPVVGTFTGAVVGGILGSKIGKKVGGALSSSDGTKAPEQSAPQQKADVSKELERLAQLHKQGILDDAEFKAAKAKLLGL